MHRTNHSKSAPGLLDVFWTCVSASCIGRNRVAKAKRRLRANATTYIPHWAQWEEMSIPWHWSWLTPKCVRKQPQVQANAYHQISALWAHVRVNIGACVFRLSTHVCILSAYQWLQRILLLKCCQILASHKLSGIQTFSRKLKTSSSREWPSGNNLVVAPKVINCWARNAVLSTQMSCFARNVHVHIQVASTKPGFSPGNHIPRGSAPGRITWDSLTSRMTKLGRNWPNLGAKERQWYDV